MKITIEEKQFDLKDVARLYPAAIITTGIENEQTPISLEWVDTLKNEETKILGYAIFVHTTDKAVESFSYESREALEVALDKIAQQMD